MKRVLSDEPHKDAALHAALRARRARWAYLVWCAAHGDAWRWDDWALYKETLAACVMLPDAVHVEVRA